MSEKTNITYSKYPIYNKIKKIKNIIVNIHKICYIIVDIHIRRKILWA